MGTCHILQSSLVQGAGPWAGDVGLEEDLGTVTPSVSSPWCDQSVLGEDFSLFLTRLVGNCCCTQISAVKDEPSQHFYPISCTVNLGDPSPLGLLACDTHVMLIYVLVSLCHPQPLTPKKPRNYRVPRGPSAVPVPLVPVL